MEKRVYFSSGTEAVKEFLQEEFMTLGSRDVDKVVNFLYKLINYEEEGSKVRANILLTSNITMLSKYIYKAKVIKFYVDENSNNFNQRIKTLMPFCGVGWTLYINYGIDFVEYGIVRNLASIKDKLMSNMLFDSSVSAAYKTKINLVHINVMSSNLIVFKGLKGNQVDLTFSLNDSFSDNAWETNISNFISDALTKIKTTKKKLEDIKTLYSNIFHRAIKHIHGTICLVIDKDFKDTKGILSDGTWLDEPIEFVKLFLNSKSFDESTLRGIADVFETMLNYDGITVIDNAGRIRAYNVFVENSKSVSKNIVGGARTRAAYTLLNTNNKKIVGVYFQSQDGEFFYKSVNDGKKDITKASKTNIAKSQFKSIENTIEKITEQLEADIEEQNSKVESEQQ